MWTNVKAIRVITADNAMMTSMDTHANAPTATLAFTAKVKPILIKLLSMKVVNSTKFSPFSGQFLKRSACVMWFIFDK